MIQPRFESAQDFQEELAALRIDGRWGSIDRNGTVIISPRFEQVKSFREGLAAVKLDGKWGFIDEAGRLEIQPLFEDVEPFSDSLAIAYKGPIGLLYRPPWRHPHTRTFSGGDSFC